MTFLRLWILSPVEGESSRSSGASILSSEREQSQFGESSPADCGRPLQPAPMCFITLGGLARRQTGRNSATSAGGLQPARLHPARLGSDSGSGSGSGSCSCFGSGLSFALDNGYSTAKLLKRPVIQIYSAAAIFTHKNEADNGQLPQTEGGRVLSLYKAHRAAGPRVNPSTHGAIMLLAKP